MISIGNFYMHNSSQSIVALVIERLPAGTHTVKWYELLNGAATPLSEDMQEIYMHPDVWTNVSNVVSEAKEWNN